MSDKDTHSSEYTDDEEFEEDDEEILLEEEALDENGDVNEELRLLEEESELTVEELRRRYYGDPIPAPTLPTNVSDQPSSSNLPLAEAQDSLKALFDGTLGTDDDSDDEYVPAVGEYWKKEVRIGDNYQVNFPLPKANVAPIGEYKPPVDSTPLWRPTRSEEEATKLRAFLTKVNAAMHEREREANGLSDEEDAPQSNRPPKSTAFADNEDALFALYRHNYDADETLKHIPFPPANGPRITAPAVPRPIDVEAFEAAFREYGKNFHLIQKNEMPEHTVGELVNFYYVWKKTERHDMFVEANRALGLPESNTKTIDPMEVLANEALGEPNAAAASAVLLTTQTTTTHQSKHWLSIQPNHSHSSQQSQHSSQPPQSSQPKP